MTGVIKDIQAIAAQSAEQDDGLSRFTGAGSRL